MKVLTNEELTHILFALIILVAVYHFIAVYLFTEPIFKFYTVNTKVINGVNALFL